MLRLVTLIESTGSLTLAAAQLGLAQSNASRSLGRWERQLGFRLVERSPRGSVLSEKGKLLAAWALPVLDGVDEFHRAVTSLTIEAGSQLVVGASQTVAEFLAPGWLGTYHADHPEVSVQLRAANSADTLTAVRESRVDIGFIESPVDVPDLSTRGVVTDQLRVIVAPTHPWARRSRGISVAELAAEPLVMREAGSGTRIAFEQAMATADVKDVASPALEVSSNAAVVGSVVAGVGPAVLSEFVIAHPVRSQSVVIVDVVGLTITRTIRAVWAPALSPPSRDFLRTALRASRLPRPGQPSRLR
ncbi:transcriptional regulator [Corynebacterium uterequi]|uniref:Transcriptional regulator n=2 Tax=Corynebacterium uterequi TaxID=1072256 RepID=A0A0G3HEM5_9CORY|nr:transcriptional regulator [Corynebacterium uterequi]